MRKGIAECLFQKHQWRLSELTGKRRFAESISNKISWSDQTEQ